MLTHSQSRFQFHNRMQCPATVREPRWDISHGTVLPITSRSNIVFFRQTKLADKTSLSKWKLGNAEGGPGHARCVHPYGTNVHASAATPVAPFCCTAWGSLLVLLLNKIARTNRGGVCACPSLNHTLNWYLWGRNNTLKDMKLLHFSFFFFK